MNVYTTPKKPIPKHLALLHGDITTPLKLPATPQLQKIGYGTGVEVLRVKRSPKIGSVRSPWAIKRLNRQCDTTHVKLYNTRLIMEADILRKLQHENVVGFRRILTDKDGRTCLAMEDGHVSLGDLLETRFDDDLGPLPADKIEKVSLDITHALKYLHNEVHLLHGDLKSFNVLIKGDFDICKLCDFGVSQPLDTDLFLDIKNHPDARYVGTDIWSSPEVFKDDLTIICDKSEIFSFGLIIYEMVALTPPHVSALFDNGKHIHHDSSVISIKDDNSSIITVNDDSIVSVKDSDDDAETDTENGFSSLFGTRPPLPDYNFGVEYNHILGLFYVCTNHEANDRPSAIECVQYIESASNKK